MLRQPPDNDVQISDEISSVKAKRTLVFCVGKHDNFWILETGEKPVVLFRQLLESA